MAFVMVCGEPARGHGRHSAESSSTASCRLRMRVLYDGTGFHGWQLQPQPKRRSVQGDLEEALTRRLGAQVRVVGASRTDTGVHALGQVAHFDDRRDGGQEWNSTELGKLEFALNRMLKSDVRVANLEVAPKLPSKTNGLPFHAIFDARGKIYTYRFQNGGIVQPLERHRRVLVVPTCNMDLVEAAMHKFVGTHDFTSFANRAHQGPAALRPVRTIHSAELVDEGEGCWCIRFHLNGALYRMVRNIMGTIFSVGTGRHSLETIEQMFASRDRRLTPKAAPAHGLCLEEVFYEC